MFTYSPGAASGTVMTPVFLPSEQAVGLAFADPGDGTRTLPVAAAKAALDENPGLGGVAGLLLGVDPTLLLEAPAAPRIVPLS